jgi:hypothetical protein
VWVGVWVGLDAGFGMRCDVREVGVVCAGVCLRSCDLLPFSNSFKLTRPHTCSGELALTDNARYLSERKAICQLRFRGSQRFQRYLSKHSRRLFSCLLDVLLQDLELTVTHHNAETDAFARVALTTSHSIVIVRVPQDLESV